MFKMTKITYKGGEGLISFMEKNHDKELLNAKQYLDFFRQFKNLHDGGIYKIDLVIEWEDGETFGLTLEYDVHGLNVDQSSKLF